ncbi:MAG: hypothetical protein WBL44_16945 [Nitrososphaeraceae archaeon]|jgi:hypothetical protein
MTRLPDQELVQEHVSQPTISISHPNKSILSLDGYLIGFVKVEANGKIIIVNSNGDQFIVPTCRIVSDDKNLVDDFVVDIEYREILQYMIIDHQTVRGRITY